MSGPDAASALLAEDPALALLVFLQQNPRPPSLAKCCKQLGLSASELHRLLALLAAPVSAGGWALIETLDSRQPVRLQLTEKGKALFSGDAPAQTTEAVER